jgi:hypothetical protein
MKEKKLLEKSLPILLAAVYKEHRSTRKFLAGSKSA